LALVSEDQIVEASAQAYATQMAEYRKEGQIDRGSGAAKRVNHISAPLIRQAKVIRPETASWKWEVNVIDDPQINAFALAGGKLAVFTGLIEKLKLTDPELAQVIAHEVGHSIAAHSREKVSVAMGSQLAAATVGSLSGLPPQALATAAQVAINLPYSRTMESEADRIGMELAARAGFDPKAAISLWNKMQRHSGDRVPQFLSTHPAPETRSARLAELVPEMTPLYKAAKQRRVGVR
jgi:predicted Zn-dependent protease